MDVEIANDLPVFRNPDVKIGLIYVLPSGCRVYDIRFGQWRSQPAGYYVNPADPRTDQEIRDSVR